MKFIRVNVSSKLVTEEQIPDCYSDIGGRGLSSIMINDWVPTGCSCIRRRHETWREFATPCGSYKRVVYSVVDGRFVG